METFRASRDQKMRIEAALEFIGLAIQEIIGQSPDLRTDEVQHETKVLCSRFVDVCSERYEKEGPVFMMFVAGMAFAHAAYDQAFTGLIDHGAI